MNFIFNEKLNCLLKIILKTALQQNIEVFLVGGVVRDYFLKAQISDIDLLVLGNAIEFANSLPSEIKIKSIHEDFCTAKIEYKDLQLDIASTRSEFYPTSGSLPVVKEIGVELNKDVARRDFTINSIYSKLSLKDDKITYQIIDLTNGQKDIENKVLKVLHEKSYLEDPTRIIKGVDFKHRFGFDFSKKDIELINDYLKNIDYTGMSIDRILSVFKKVLSSKNQKEIFKEIIEKKYYKILFNHELSINFLSIEKIITKFNLKKENIAKLYLKIIENKPITKKVFSCYLDLYKTFHEYLLSDLAYYDYKTQDENIDTFLKFKKQELLISGKDLLDLNYKQGKLFSEIMNNLMEEKLKTSLNDNKIWDKKEEINWVLKHYPQN